MKYCATLRCKICLERAVRGLIPMFTINYFRNFGFAIGMGSSGAGFCAIFLSPLVQLSLDNLGLGNTLIIYGLSMMTCNVSLIIFYLESKAITQRLVYDRKPTLAERYTKIFTSADTVLLFVYLGMYKTRERGKTYLCTSFDSNCVYQVV